MSEQIRLPAETSAGLYVALDPKPERIANGAKITMCKRCGKLVGHYPRDSMNHEVVCLTCANDIPAIRQHLDQLAKSRGD